MEVQRRPGLQLQDNQQSVPAERWGLIMANNLALQDYPVTYPTGAGGTWVSWLINQHDNFPKIRLEEDSEFYNKKSDMGTFHFGIAARRRLDSGQSSQQFLQQFIDHNPDYDSQFTKYSYKPSPHAPSSVLDYIDQTDNHIFHTNTKLVILGVFTNVAVFKTRNDYINSLHNIYAPFGNSSDQYINGNNQDCHSLLTTCDNIGIAAAIFDAGKLLFGDTQEYHRLCDYVDEQPLPDYADHVAHAVKKVWDKFK